MQEQLSTKRRFSQQNLLKFKEEISKMLHLEYSLYGAENCTLRKIEHKYLESFEMWWWKRMKIGWTDRVRNEEG